MNKIEKIICLVLGAVLAWYIWAEMGKSKERAAQAAKQQVTVSAESSSSGNPRRNTAVSPRSDSRAETQPAATADKASEDSNTQTLSTQTPSLPAVPEKAVVLENSQLKLELSSWGAVVKKATLKEYAKDCGEISEQNPAVVLDFTSAPLGELDGVTGLAPNAAYEVRDVTSNSVVFVNAVVTRKITLGDDFQVTFDETFHSQPQPSTSTSLSLGAMSMGNSKNDQLSIDSWALDIGKGKAGVVHHYEGDSPLKPFLVGGYSGGCSGSSSAAGMPRSQSVKFPGAQKWIALKNRFFVTALCSSTSSNGGFDTTVTRDMRQSNYRPDTISAKALFAEVPAQRTSVFFVGPKKQSLLWDLGMRDVMDFGMWRWICYPIVSVLNIFNDWIPNYGIAIILLTILVRLVFWPLTRKSTEGMKKMQEVQPLMKEIQAKYKDNPQRLQQETWALYKEKKVNPLSSCLPMLIQIPVFIALFNVLRSAVELRYAPFLWIADLSEPEGLLAAYLPFGGLNILPILMAVSTGLQSYFTPSAGDKGQQKMMTVFMPVMMLVMFYSFPAALSLYWFLSNLFSIVQMWLIRRSTRS